MAEVDCSRCGSRAPGLGRPPLPGPSGERVRQQTCSRCWDEWKRFQVRLINEYRLDAVDPASYEKLLREMATFLNLHDEETADG